MENLVQEGYDESTQLYDKLFAQLRKSSANLNTKLCGRTIAIIHKYAEIFKDNTDRRENITDLAQFYIDRFNDSVKIVEKQVETEVVLQTLDNIRSL